MGICWLLCLLCRVLARILAVICRPVVLVICVCIVGLLRVSISAGVVCRWHSRSACRACRSSGCS